MMPHSEFFAWKVGVRWWLPIIEQEYWMLLPYALAILHTLCDLRVTSPDDEAEKVPIWACCAFVESGVEGAQSVQEVAGVGFKVDAIRR